ncbi:Os12g0220800 [Oryza sativa Japonica Group]|uniref:Os12g0220800 protein n=1 Tax=Oryza sativa subsp. japonica TaxID=39947 RepID=A0A0P0Y890_ORYSJ|nr:Os12g0220800 [Oryza sativa Japonica Group]
MAVAVASSPPLWSSPRCPPRLRRRASLPSLSVLLSSWVWMRIFDFSVESCFPLTRYSESLESNKVTRTWLRHGPHPFSPPRMQTV